MSKQYVKLDLSGRAYTYAWSHPGTLGVGDLVVVPGNVVNPEPATVRVIRLMDKPDYDGKITEIIERVPDPCPICQSSNCEGECLL